MAKGHKQLIEKQMQTYAQLYKRNADLTYSE